MKKTIITAVVAATLSISSVSFAGGIEKAERYSAPLEQQTVGNMNVSAAKTEQKIVALSELEVGEKGLGSNAEIDDLGWFAIWSGKTAHDCFFCWGKDN